MKEVQELLAVAMIGTSRATLPQHAGSPLSEHLNAAQGDTEGQLLSRAALAGLVQFAGRRANPFSHEPPPPAPVETLREAPARFASHLPVVAGSPVINEWVRLCAQAGWRVPHAALPALLDLARTDTTLRENLRPVLGERGAWLAQFNPDWRFNATHYTEESWLDATETQKEGLFRDLLEKAPETAHALLWQHFRTEKAGVRKRLLHVLQETWPDANTELEPLLEDALTDRSADVQELARSLLQRQPGSAYNARMADRTRAMFRDRPPGLLARLSGQLLTALHLPETHDADLKRDGLTPPDPQDRNAAAKHCRSLIGGTHPQALMHRLNLSAPQLVKVAGQIGALDRLQQATLITGDTLSAQALRPHLEDDLALLPLTPPDEVLDILRNELKKGQAASSRFQRLLHHAPTPWPEDISASILQSVQESVVRIGHHTWDTQLEQLLMQTALHAHPDTPLPAEFPAETQDTSYSVAHMHGKFSEMLTILQHRQRMHRDFREAQS